MATLTSSQLSDLRADLGDVPTTTFTDDELNRLYTRAESDYIQTIVLALRQMLANANKFHDYTAGEDKVTKSQVRAHLKDTLLYYEGKSGSQQVQIVAMRSVPPRDKDEPSA
jgi:hypothetical protein